MPEAAAELYQRRWNLRDYLQQYYSSEVFTDDEAAHAQFATRMLAAAGRRYRRLLEVGCGPTIHHAAMLAPLVDEIHLADFLPENLAEIRRWMRGDPDAHNWDQYLQGVLSADKASGSNRAADDLTHRKQMLRQKVTRFHRVDLCDPAPLVPNTRYDLVASFYCAECIGASRETWMRALGNLARFLSGGGSLLLGTLRRSREYRILGDRFPVAFIDESDIAATLPRLGFPPDQTTIEVHEVADWADQGFSSICCVLAAKCAR